MCDTKSLSDSLFLRYRNAEKNEMIVFINPNTKEAIKKHLQESSQRYGVELKLNEIQSLVSIPLVQVLKIEFMNGSVSRIINHETKKTVFP